MKKNGKEVCPICEGEVASTCRTAHQETGLFTATAPETWSPDVDLDRRVLRNAAFGTTGLAADGIIILPSGMSLATYIRNPIVTARHMLIPGEPIKQDAEPIVIARTLKIHADDWELHGDEVQFADNDLGRQYAYLYGVNPDREAYMRMWSTEVFRIESTGATFEQARRISGKYWDENIAARVASATRGVRVWTKTDLAGVSVAALGADRGALTRAANAGVVLAGELVARIDLSEARTEVADLKRMISENSGRIDRIEKQIQALGRDGASAATRGDSEALLKEIRALRALVK
jgi:polyhydroxyalkanoate synthesis regulator phasin